MFKANFSNFIFAKITASSNGFTAKGITYDGDLKETFVSFDNIKDEVWGKIFPQVEATAPQVEATAPQVEATAPQVEATAPQAFAETTQIKRGRGRPRKIVA